MEYIKTEDNSLQKSTQMNNPDITRDLICFDDSLCEVAAMEPKLPTMDKATIDFNHLNWFDLLDQQAAPLEKNGNSDDTDFARYYEENSGTSHANNMTNAANSSEIIFSSFVNNSDSFFINIDSLNSAPKATTIPTSKPQANNVFYERLKTYERSVRNWSYPNAPIFCPECGRNLPPWRETVCHFVFNTCYGRFLRSSFPFRYFFRGKPNEYLYCAHCDSSLAFYDHSRQLTCANEMYVIEPKPEDRLLR